MFRRAKKGAAEFMTQLSPDDPFVQQLGEPGEVFWVGLEVLDWKLRQTLGVPREVCERMLVLTSNRLLELDKYEQRIEEIRWEHVRNPAVRTSGAMGFLTMDVEFADGRWVPHEWSTKRGAAQALGEKLIDYYNEAKH